MAASKDWLFLDIVISMSKKGLLYPCRHIPSPSPNRALVEGVKKHATGRDGAALVQRGGWVCEDFQGRLNPIIGVFRRKFLLYVSHHIYASPNQVVAKAAEKHATCGDGIALMRWRG